MEDVVLFGVMEVGGFFCVCTDEGEWAGGARGEGV